MTSYYEMDFNSWKNTTVTLLPIDCTYEFNQGLLVAFNFSLMLFVLSRMFNWCADPLASRLAEKVAELEEENRQLVEDLNEANDELEEKCGTLQDLRDVLRIKRDLESDAETESVSKRRRVA